MPVNRKKFNLFGKKYTIEYVDELKPLNDDDNSVTYGITCHPECTIQVAKKVKGKAIDKEDVEITRLHEIMHAIFDAGDYHSCNDDEPLVQWCARCLYALKKQGII